MGVTLSVTSFTCTAPFVGSLLAVGAKGGVMRVVLGMAVFGATMASLFVVLSLIPGKMKQIPRAGDWMHTLKVYLGFLELAAALKFVSNVDIAWQWHLLPRELFLFLWFAIFVCSALYLLGLIRMTGETGEVSPWRMVAGVATLLLAIYCGFGALGHQMDRITTAFLPDYSSGGSTLLGKAGGAKKGHTIVVDDLEAARKAAIAEDKLVLINFTGHV
jgi:thiol:disulfide interchange protein